MSVGTKELHMIKVTYNLTQITLVMTYEKAD